MSHRANAEKLVALSKTTGDRHIDNLNHGERHKMRPKKSKEQVLNERAEDLRTLFIYFSVTRLVQCQTYWTTGFFDWERFQYARRFYKDWKAGKIRKSIENRKLYGKLLAAWNETLGIPTELISDVIGKFHHNRIPFDEVRSRVEGYNNLRGGKRVYKGQVKGTFLGKYIPTSGVEWKKLLDDERYHDLETIPNASERVKKIIREWEAGQKSEQEETSNEILQKETRPSSTLRIEGSRKT